MLATGGYWYTVDSAVHVKGHASEFKVIFGPKTMNRDAPPVIFRAKNNVDIHVHVRTTGGPPRNLRTPTGIRDTFGVCACNIE